MWSVLFDNKDYLVSHAYDATENSKPKLPIKDLKWDKNEWLEVIL